MTKYTLFGLAGLLFGVGCVFYFLSGKSSRPWTWREAICLAGAGIAVIVLTIVTKTLLATFLSIPLEGIADDVTTTVPLGMGTGLILVAVWLLLLERFRKGNRLGVEQPSDNKTRRQVDD